MKDNWQQDIINARYLSNINQSRLARLCDISQSMVSLVFRGLATPTLDTARVMAHESHLTLDSFDMAIRILRVCRAIGRSIDEVVELSSDAKSVYYSARSASMQRAMKPMRRKRIPAAVA